MMKSLPKIWVDMDGVTADFDRHYIEEIGPLPPRDGNNRDVDWEEINKIDFFLTMPPMPDADLLWGFLAGLPNPKGILTGVPSSGTERASRNKVSWAAHQPFIPAGTEVRCLRSRDKFKHCTPGDILIDDWTKYKAHWEGAGGIFITHTSAADTIRQLKNVLARQILDL
jgi:hypothetical protein